MYLLVLISDSSVGLFLSDFWLTGSFFKHAPYFSVGSWTLYIKCVKNYRETDWWFLPFKRVNITLAAESTYRSFKYYSVRFSSAAQLCPTLCDPMNHSTPGLPVHHRLPEFTQTQRPPSPWCHPVISSSVVPFSSCPQSLPASEFFPTSQLFSWGGQSTGL